MPLECFQNAGLEVSPQFKADFQLFSWFEQRNSKRGSKKLVCPQGPEWLTLCSVQKRTGEFLQNGLPYNDDPWSVHSEVSQDVTGVHTVLVPTDIARASTLQSNRERMLNAQMGSHPFALLRFGEPGNLTVTPAFVTLHFQSG